MSNEVGFAFQADVVNLGSLTHMMTGRVLKALSDGGVDTYAVAAAFWLGAKIPVRSSLADTVHMHVSQRPAYYSVLNKLLSIGWGHSTPVIEMTRTRAGTNALLLVGALGEGTSTFQAAQCISELLTIYGLGPDMMPSTDVLKGLVAYLTPFVYDLGFSKVLQHITNVAEGAIEAEAFECHTRRDYQAIYETEQHMLALKCLGPPDSLARAIKQLVYTSQKGQQHYMILGMRGSWLPAFASHVLGMSVQLFCGDKLVWASGGEHGSITFQIGKEPQHGPSLLSSPEQLTIVALSELDGMASQNISITLSLEDALESQFVKWPQIDSDLAIAIHAAIRRLSIGLFYGTLPKDWQYNDTASRPAGIFDGRAALETVLDVLQVKEDKLANASWADLHCREGSFPAVSPGRISLTQIDATNLTKLINLCALHQDQEDSVSSILQSRKDKDCLCQKVGKAIHGFAATALALMQCKFEPSQLRLREEVLAGSHQTKWSNGLVLGKDYPESHSFPPSNDAGRVSTNDMLHYLGVLITRDYTEPETFASRPNFAAGTVLGVSGGAYTIYYSCIMDSDCYDEAGRLIQIQSGRVSVQGSFRKTILEFGEGTKGHTWYRETMDPSQLTGSSRLKPHYRPPKTTVGMKIQLAEETIILQFWLKTAASQAFNCNVKSSIGTFLTLWMVPRCHHDVNSPYKVKTDRELALEGFHVAKLASVDFDVLIYALKGNKLEQILTCGLIVKQIHQRFPYRDPFEQLAAKSPGVIQVLSCLECSIRLAKEIAKDDLAYVIMGG